MPNEPTLVGNRYRITGSLGGGGMKVVRLAEDLRLNQRLCAVAEMIDHFAKPEDQKQAILAFEREADMLAGLKNQHIPQIYDRFSEENRHYLVMEYVEGDTLEQRIQAAGHMSEREVIEIGIQIAETLEYLHGHQPPIIYRDMKPGNVMLTPEGFVKLIDFGIARLFQSSRAMTMVGTVGYAPYEQYQGKVEPRSDIYALGATLHEALSGRPPVPFDFPPLIELRPDCNKSTSDLLKSALAYQVDGRPASATEFRQRLEAIRSGAKPSPAKPSPALDKTLPLARVIGGPDDVTVRLQTAVPSHEEQTVPLNLEARPRDTVPKPSKKTTRRGPKRALIIGTAVVASAAVIGAASTIAFVQYNSLKASRIRADVERREMQTLLDQEEAARQKAEQDQVQEQRLLEEERAREAQENALKQSQAEANSQQSEESAAAASERRQEREREREALEQQREQEIATEREAQSEQERQQQQYQQQQQQYQQQEQNQRLINAASSVLQGLFR